MFELVIGMVDMDSSCVYLHLQVAELGGTLGLFLGFSFLGVFDALVNISRSTINVFYEKYLREE